MAGQRRPGNPRRRASTIDQPWSGYRWEELVPSRGLRYPASGTTPMLAWTTSWPSSMRRSTGSPSTPRVMLRRGTWKRRSPPGTTRTIRATSFGAVARAGGQRGRASSRGPRATLERFDELLGRRVSMRALALLRILAGPAVLLHLRPFIADAIDGRSYRDAFYEPYASWYPEPPARSTSRCYGWRHRGGGHVGRTADAHRDRGDVRNRHIQPLLIDDPLSQQPRLSGDRACRADGRALRSRALGRRVAARAAQAPAARYLRPGWPLWLLRFEASAIYGASGLSKLLDSDWFGGTVTWLRVVRARDQLAASPLPAWAVRC